MKVSVIVPVFCVEQYIDRCIRSLLRQTLRDIEIVCICPQTDKSYKIIEKYIQKDKRVILIQKENTGVSAARNVGIEKASGQYIAFVDGDDWLERYALEVLYLAAQKYEAQILCYGMYPTLEPPDEKQAMFGSFTKRNVIYRTQTMKALFYEHGSRPYIGNKFYQRKFLMQENLRFNESISIGEDQLLQFEAFYKADTVCFLREKLYHYETGRKNSAMALCEASETLKGKNAELLLAVMQHKRECVGHTYDKEYLWWILQDFSWLSQIPCMKEQTADILRELDISHNIGFLPKEYMHIAGNLLSAPDAEADYCVPYKITDNYRRTQVRDIAEEIAAGNRFRRLYEWICFHELRHLCKRVQRKIKMRGNRG